MTVIHTLVAKSEHVNDAALNLNAKAFELRQTLAGVWDLAPSTTEPPHHSKTFHLDMKNESGESVVGDEDERVKVDERDFMPGGKYRSIVKLFIHYEFQEPGKYAMGTGWLIKDDVLVTAGHCTYDWSHKLGRATEVKAYIGYKGRDAVNDPNVQFRTGKRIVTTEGWLKTRGTKSFDVGFIQVNKPFTGILPIKYEETPVNGEFELGVVGYPGDLTDKQTGEKGAFMYEMFLPTKFDLATQTDTMLEYSIDTFGGNSGSPVLKKPDMSSIGAHVYGGSLNSASVIGRYGNPYNDYLIAFNLPVLSDGLNFIPVTGPAAVKIPSLPSIQTTPTPVGLAPAFTHEGTYMKDPMSVAMSVPRRSAIAGINSTPISTKGASMSMNGTFKANTGGGVVAHSTEGEEGFFDFMRDALKVGAPLVGGALRAGLPIAMGPLGGPIGALAGLALNAAGKLAESADAESGGLDTSTANVHEGSMERAVLAEAALTAVQTMNLNPADEESIFSDMKDYITKAAPTIKKVAPHIMGAMMEPALRVAMDSLHKYNEKGLTGAEALEDEATAEPFRYTAVKSNQRGDLKAEAFINGVHRTLTQGQESLDSESEEGFFDFICSAVRTAAPVVSSAAKVGLPILAKVLSSAAGAESLEDSTAPTGPVNLSSQHLAKRAIAGEAALQALMKLPPKRLEEEGFFDVIGSVIKTVAPVVMKVAPTVISAINPTVGKILKAATGQESTFVNGSGMSKGRSSNTAATVPPGAPKALARKQSRYALSQEVGSNNDFLGKVKSYHDRTSTPYGRS